MSAGASRIEGLMHRPEGMINKSPAGAAAIEAQRTTEGAT
jgi:hypothetical protein